MTCFAKGCTFIERTKETMSIRGEEVPRKKTRAYVRGVQVNYWGSHVNWSEGSFIAHSENCVRPQEPRQYPDVVQRGAI